MEISSKFQPNEIEEKWYNYWMKKGINHSEIDKIKESFTIVIPPPNITGALHMGHALNNTLQDIFIRFAKKNGYNTCWLPGTDHGGIATQNIVEKLLLKDGIKKNDLGREKFLEVMWKWRKETGDTILMQLKRIGCLCDWDRTRFTMDDDCAEAVFYAFKTLYDEGLIYRGNYMVNWCPRCHTALSDIEVEHNEQNGNLWHIKYPIKDSNDFIIVATTRPETMFGDTAVAVNPDDERYKNLIGKTLILPIVNREIKIIADEMVEKGFGTGAVKITPSHDVNDYETAKRHNLEFITVIDKNGKILDLDFIPEKFHNLDRFEARKQVALDLESQNLLLKTENYKNNVSVCYRCNTVIEPSISPQFYLNTKDLAKSAIEASKKGEVSFLPESWEKPYLNWMENLHDWCISRQIWWGHRIPIWYCDNCKDKNNQPSIIISKEKPSKCPHCGNTENFTEETDVLDTWFSSALWPLSTLGFPKSDKDLNYFYPTQVLATGHEILYLWVARMIMMGLKFKGEVPFRKVYIHGIVRDSHGKKMSKSLGNVIDPLKIVEEFGTDALRFSLTYNGIMGRDLQMSNDSFLMSRNFCNKLWNASRLILMNLDEFLKDKNNKDLWAKDELKNLELETSDKWILSSLEKTKIEVKKFYDKSDFSMVARISYEFIWSKYCDWYLEFSKARIYGNNENEKKIVYSVLITVLSEILNFINPIIPFITEEINENINKILNIENKDIATKVNFDKEIALNNFIDEKAENDIQTLINIISGIRNVRAEMNIPLTKEFEIFIKYEDESKTLNEETQKYILKLTKSIKIVQGINIEKPKKSSTVITKDYQIFVPLEGLIDFEKEKEKIEKNIKNLEQELEKANKKLGNDNFVKNAPVEEFEKVKEKKESYLEQILKLKENLEEIN